LRTIPLATSGAWKCRSPYSQQRQAKTQAPSASHSNRRRTRLERRRADSDAEERSLTLTQATYAQFAAIIRGHWGIEDRLHWVRDTDFDEDHSQVRTASGPRIMASLRNLAINILRMAGAAGLRPAPRGPPSRGMTLRRTTPHGAAGPAPPWRMHNRIPAVRS